MNKNEMLLLAIGNGNWNYYLKTSVEKRQRSLCPTDVKEVVVHNVYYVATEKAAAQGCKSGWFGELNHIRMIWRRYHNMTLTELGEQIIAGGLAPAL